MRASRIFIVAVSVAFGGWVLYSLMHVEPIRVVESHLRHENGRTYVEGKIENTGIADASTNLEVRYYDGGGRRLAVDTIAFDKLQKGRVTSFRTQPRALDGATDFSLSLSHGPNPYGN